MEFLYPMENNQMKGFIDLIFEHQGKTYILDWKTNIVRSSLEETMQEGDYFLQAKIYKKALPQDNFGGIYYLFLREKKALYIEDPK